MALRAVPEHPKFARLKGILKTPKGATLGWLECIWHFTGKFTPRGNIGKYSDLEIEAWVEWDGEPGVLISALITSQWLDLDPEHRILVHDWALHADNATKLAVKRSKTEFCVHTVSTLSQQSVDGEQKIATPLRLPVPEPVPVPEPESSMTTAQKRRGCRLPGDFAVTETHRLFARAHELISPDFVIDEFRDYWAGVPGSRGVKLDWDATFRNRIREKTKPNGGMNASRETKRERDDREFAAARARLEA